jgi:pimeloyl-ACP methyl ester carboxylesterase
MRIASVMILCTVAAGCSADRPMNPSFAVPMADAKAILRQMQDDPKTLERPLVVAGGIHDPGFVTTRVARTIRRTLDPDDLVTTVSFTGRGKGTFDDCRDYLIESVEKAFGTTNGPATVEVDVIAFSMGGLVVRHAARHRDDGGKQLNVRRLFTISTPHRGARMAGLPTLDHRAVAMRHGSEFLAGLDEALSRAPYELYTYARLGDGSWPTSSGVCGGRSRSQRDPLPPSGPASRTTRPPTTAGSRRRRVMLATMRHLAGPAGPRARKDPGTA